MDFEEWYVKLGEWADENTALNMSYAMQRHLARRLAEWEKAAQQSVQSDAPMWRCRACGSENSHNMANCVHCGRSGRR